VLALALLAGCSNGGSLDRHDTGPFDVLGLDMDGQVSPGDGSVDAAGDGADGGLDAGIPEAGADADAQDAAGDAHDSEPDAYVDCTLAPNGSACSLGEGMGVCLDGACVKACNLDADCDDGNPCNGEETCNLELHGCTPGEPLECDDGHQCTTNGCDPEENPETGCVFTLIDEDGDGFAPDHLDCDERGGDCDDSDPDIHPAAERICGDGIDNNCLGYTHDEQVPVWSPDCDGDGYAPSGALAIESCTKPATTAECLDWTQRTPSGLSNTDCDDSNVAVYPGARNSTNNGWYTRPYCHGTGMLASGSAGSFSCSTGTPSWDYDCNGIESKRYTNVNYSDASSCQYYPWIPIYTISTDGADEGDATESSGAVHKSTLWSDPEETGLIIICYDCPTIYCTTGGGYTASSSPSCGFEAEFRQCSGDSTCPCLSSTAYCNSTLSQQMQECR
jgi:hypothetical protein